MKKPDENLIRLCELGCIEKVSIEYLQTGTDTADTYVTFENGKKKLRGLLSTYAMWLDFRPTHRAVWDVPRRFVDEVIAWKEFEKNNAKELAEYKRLKAKFEAE